MPERKLLLARPHPFIMGPMADALTQGGFLPVARSAGATPSLDDDIVGAVISTAVVSSVPEHYADVYITIRNRCPTLPVVFATLLVAEQFAAVLRDALARRGASIDVATLEALVRGDAMERTPRLVLLVDKSAMERHAALVPALLQGWFLGAEAVARR